VSDYSQGGGDFSQGVSDYSQGVSDYSQGVRDPRLCCLLWLVYKHRLFDMNPNAVKRIFQNHNFQRML